MKKSFKMWMPYEKTAYDVKNSLGQSAYMGWGQEAYPRRIAPDVGPLPLEKFLSNFYRPYLYKT